MFDSVCVWLSERFRVGLVECEEGVCVLDGMVLEINYSIPH